MADEMNADVVIVGGGVAGGLIASWLASNKTKVVILESGPWVDRGNAFNVFLGSLAKGAPDAPYPSLAYAPHPIVEDLKAYYVQEGPEEFQSTYTRRVGGTTWHWLGTSLRLVPNDFRMRSEYGVSVDWPIRYNDLEPWYGQAEHELGVSGDSGQDLGSPRSRPYPLAPIPQTYLDKQWAAAAAAIGLTVQSTPQARNSQPYDNRPACCGANNCIPLCPIGAKYDGAVHIQKAQKAGAQVLDQAVVHLIEVDQNRRVVAVRYKRPDRSEHRVTGRVFVIAAHAIETPKLLLMSRSETAPNGVANSSDQVGRNLMDHPTQLSWALSKDPVYPYRGPLATSGIEQLRDGDFRRERAAFRIEIGNDGWSWPVADPTGEVGDWIKQGLRGKALITKVNEHVSREIRLASLMEQQPNPENRITPAYDNLDAIGIPRPRIRYRLDPFAQRGLSEAIATHNRLFDAIGVVERHHWKGFQGAGHVMGTYRMGDDPKASVVDRDCRTHDHPNLFLLGSGVFPTVGTANPTLTIAALALRAADPVMRTLSA